MGVARKAIQGCSSFAFGSPKQFQRALRAAVKQLTVLVKANVVGIFTETTTADVETVFPDDADAGGAYSATA